MVVASYLGQEHLSLEPSIRLSINRLLDESNVKQTIKILDMVSDSVLTIKN